jgi:hypothetical protein
MYVVSVTNYVKTTFYWSPLYFLHDVEYYFRENPVLHLMTTRSQKSTPSSFGFLPLRNVTKIFTKKYI